MLSEERLSLLRQMAHGLAVQFGPACEVVIHDLTDGPEHTVVHIENGHVSGRSLGSGPSHVVLESLRPDGKVLKSSTLFIRDPSGKPEAIFSINYDISALLTVEQAVRPLVTPREPSAKEPERITRSVSDLLDDLLRESVELVGKPVALMDREDKIRAIRFLNDAGALLITKSGDKIAAFFGISKYTLYSYLDDKNG